MQDTFKKFNWSTWQANGEIRPGANGYARQIKDR